MPDPQEALQLLETLALTGATTVAAAMATDAWQTARSGIGGLFHRSEPVRQQAIEAQLDANAALVARAPDAERARLGVVPLWQLELEELLHDHPEAVGELKVLVDQVQDVLPEAQKNWVQTNIARDNGHVFAAQGPGSKVIVHQVDPTQAQPSTPDETTGDAW